MCAFVLDVIISNKNFDIMFTRVVIMYKIWVNCIWYYLFIIILTVTNRCWLTLSSSVYWRWLHIKCTEDDSIVESDLFKSIYNINSCKLSYFNLKTTLVYLFIIFFIYLNVVVENFLMAEKGWAPLIRLAVDATEDSSWQRFRVILY